ncbi:unnamed protein product [Prorocentrum cordatum]|uniref:Uncharacterized protein n=1 Tax=Prorocentrum cordatum TaxID=2364126 RepID=A0ABN9T845_9DINO|nr:unnamed protein product [Polarella glacialis]
MAGIAGDAPTKEGPAAEGAKEVPAVASVPTPLRAEAVPQPANVIAAARSRLCAAVTGNVASFELSLEEFSALIGDGGKELSDALSSGGPRTGVLEGAAVERHLGDSPAAAAIGRITLEHNGAGRAKLTSELAKGQSSLLGSLAAVSKRGAEELTAKEAAAAAAKASQQSPFVIESDEEEEAAAKRPRAA